MGASCAELPVEILQCIFSKLSRSDLSQSQRVCKKWSGTARKLCYEHVEIGVPQEANKYSRTITESQDCVGNLVKSINLYTLFSFRDAFDQDDECLFNCIVNLCPNLKKLAAYNPSSYFWGRLLEQATNNRLSLYSIPSEMSPWDYEIYSRVALAMRSTLEHVSLFDPQVSIYTQDEQLDRETAQFIRKPLVLALGQFPNLKAIEIEIRTNSSIYSFDSFIEQCPLLESLTLNIHPLSQENPKNHIDVYKLDDRSTKLNLALIRQRPGIKKLAGHIPLYTDESIEYFLHKFPKLNSLDMNFRTDNMELTEALSSCRNTLESSDVMLAYFQNIFDIPSYNVHNISVKSPAKFLARLVKATKFSGLVDIGYENSEDTTWFWDTSNSDDLRLQVHNDSDRWISNQASKPTITAHFDADEDHRFLMDDNSQHIPHLGLIQEIGNYIQHLRLNDFNKKLVCLSSRPEDKEKDTDMRNGNQLALILGQCPNLKSLTLNNMDLIESTQDETVMSETLEELSISFSRLDTNVLTNYSARLPRLKKLNLSRNILVNPLAFQCYIHMPYTSLDTILFLLDAVEQNMKNDALVNDKVVMQDEDDAQDGTTDDAESAISIENAAPEGENEDTIEDNMEADNDETMEGNNEDVIENNEDFVEDNEQVIEDNGEVIDDDFVMDEEEVVEDDDMDGIYAVDGDDIEGYLPVKTFYVKLETADQQETRWFYGDDDDIKASSSEDYYSNGSGSFLFDIKCKNVGKLLVEFHDRNEYQKCEFDKIK